MADADDYESLHINQEPFIGWITNVMGMINLE